MYLWSDCQDIGKTKIVYSILCPFEWMHLWMNYNKKLRTIIINTLLWSKMMSLNCFKISTQKIKCQTDELTEHAGKGM